MTACCAVLVVLMLQTAPSMAGASAVNPAHRQTSSQSQPQNQQANPSIAQSQPQQQPTAGDDLFSLDRIRRDLERQGTLTLFPRNASLPVYRLIIQGYQFRVPSWRDNFPPGPRVPEPVNGSDFYRVQQLATLPQAWGSPTPFANAGVTDVYGLPSVSGMIGGLINKAVEARRNAAASRLRAEVQQELADIAAHNARVAAGQADPDEKKKKKK